MLYLETPMRAVHFALILALAPSAALARQSNVVVISPGDPSNPHSGPATFNLIPKEPGARTGRIWVNYADDGLDIYGEIGANPSDVRSPAEKKDMLASDHVEVWLSTTTGVALPPIGYGNQFGENDLKSAADCGPLENESEPGSPRTSDVGACQSWYADQLEYRKQFERLFTRQWLTAAPEDNSGESGHFEDFATSAYNSLSAGFYANELPDLLRPKSDDGFKSTFSPILSGPKSSSAQGPQPKMVVTGYRFDILIPWDAFPPSNDFNLNQFWLMVDVFTHAPAGKKMGALSTTSPERVWGKPATFNRVALKAPRQYIISPCSATPTLTDLYGDSHPAWYFPTAGADPLILSSVFDIENPAGGYMYSPSSVSPIVRQEEHFWKSLPDGATVCGPDLAWQKGKLIKPSKFDVEKKYFEVKPLDDGWLIVRTGPDMGTLSQFGSGQCGACPTVNLQMYAISPDGEASLALVISSVLSGFGDQPADADFTIAPDWSRITYFVDTAADSENAQSDTWSSTTFCLAGHTYNKCGAAKNTTPPNPRFITPD